MATIISLKKEEKLAILKIMIETNNHYSNKGLPKAFEFIQDTANYFRLSSDDISEVFLIDSNDIRNILKESFGKSLDKEIFFKQLMNYMLIVGQNVDYRNGRKRWGYINLLTDGCLSSNFIFTYANNPLKNVDWYLIHDEQSNQKKTVQLGNVNHSIIQPVEQLNSSIIYQSCPNVKNDQPSNDKIAKYTDATKEKLAILRFLFELNHRFALSKGSGFIQDTANYLGIARIKKKAHLMTLDDAKNILGRTIENDSSKKWFVESLFNYFLRNPELGTNAQKKLFKDAILIIGKNIYSNYSQTTDNPLTNSNFRLIKKDDINTFTIRYNTKNGNYIPEERTLRTESPKTKSQSIVRNEPNISNKKDSSYSHEIKEILYKDL